MSHISKIEMEIKSLPTLKAACNRMGLTFKEGQKSYKWYGNQEGKCDHAIQVPGATYELGIVETPGKPGQFDMLWDSWSSGGLAKKLGQDAGLLKQAYAIEQTKAVAAIEGHYCNEVTQDDGTIHLQIMM